MMKPSADSKSGGGSAIYLRLQSSSVGAAPFFYFQHAEYNLPDEDLFASKMSLILSKRYPLS